MTAPIEAPRETLVREIMQVAVTTVLPTQSLELAAQTMQLEGVTCLVIDLKDRTRGFGILTQKDVIGFIFDGDLDFEGTTVEDVMTHPCVTLSSEFNLDTAVGLMRMMGVRRAPVVDSGVLVGVMSFTDIFNHALGKGAPV
jgi:CBS domain-containing protein